MFNGTDLGYKRKSLVNIASTLCVCSAFLVLSQGKVNAAVQNTTNEEDSTENVSNSISEYNINAQSVALSDASSVTSESSSDNDAVSQETVVASSTAVIGDTNNDASSESAAAVSDVNENSATSDVDSTSTEYTSDSNIVNVIDLGAVDSVNDVEAAKAAAEQVYEETGQAQTITASMVSSYSYTDAFLDSIKAGAIQGWVNYRILPSVTAAQAICESAWGRSDLATSAHNLFGIKGSYNGNSVTYPTAEWGSGGYYTINAAFRAYSSNSESVADHGNFLVSNSRYANLINNRNYVSVANNLQADGYATSPTYASTLIGIVQQYGRLTSWDTEAFAITDKVNSGSMDEAKISGDTLTLAGWHVATDAQGKNNAFIILLDANTNDEIARYRVPASSRPDMGRIFSNVSGSSNSGFNLSIPYSNQIAGKNLTVIHRYSSSTDGNTDYVDYNFGVNLNKNEASLDAFSINNDGKLTIGGWNAADATKKYANHFIILLDESTGKEISRYSVKNYDRYDVQNTYSNVYNSVYSGFSINIDFPVGATGHTLKVISRYSSSSDGNDNYVDYEFASKTFNQNEGSLDNFEIEGKTLHIAGWNATNQSINKPFHTIIIYNKTKNKEIERFNSDLSSRADVANSFRNIYNASNSGFNLNVALTNDMVGDDITVVSRYSDKSNGQGNVADYWFNERSFSSNEGSLDKLQVVGDELKISGWNANDLSTGLSRHFIILYDSTNNKEILRVKVDPTPRKDVAVAFPNVYQAGLSGFQTTVKLTQAMVGVKLQVISRYSDAINGEGKNADYWFNSINLTGNDGSLDYIHHENDSISVEGWHTSNLSAGLNYNSVILWDVTDQKELIREQTSSIERDDVNDLFPNVYNSLHSGFFGEFDSSLFKFGHSYQIIDRYSSRPNGQGTVNDYWSKVFTL